MNDAAQFVMPSTYFEEVRVLCAPAMAHAGAINLYCRRVEQPDSHLLERSHAFWNGGSGALIAFDHARCDPSVLWAITYEKNVGGAWIIHNVYFRNR